MNRILTFFAASSFLLALLCGTAAAKWSLLEDYQMTDLSGDKGVCLSSIMDDCDFDIHLYGVDYPEDELKDDMDEARQSGLEMIVYDFSFKHPYIPFPGNVPAHETPVPGEPFFQSDWYTPDLSGWEKLCEKLLDSLPCQ